MLINSARRMPSIGRRISIEVGDLARRLSAKILGSYIEVPFKVSLKAH